MSGPADDERGPAAEAGRGPGCRVSILTTLRDPVLPDLEETISSVLAQDMTEWEWILLEDVSNGSAARERMSLLAAEEPRVRVVERVGTDLPARAVALADARGEWVVLLVPGDVLAPRALGASLEAIDAAQAAGAPVDYCYSDQDRIAPDGQLHDRDLKPDWSPERLRHHLYTGQLSLLRRSLVVEVGGFRAGYDGAHLHDLVLRVTERARSVLHVNQVLLHERDGEEHDADREPAWDAGTRAVQDHLDRVGIHAEAARGHRPGFYLVRRAPDLSVPVSVVIPTRGSRALIWGTQRLLVREAIRTVRLRSSLETLEVVVVVDTSTPLDVLEQLERLPSELAGLTVRLVAYDRPFNFSEKCNLGALHASHDVLVFLNDDTQAASDGMLEQLVAPLGEPGVGMTGARLLFEDTRIQHAGVRYGSGRIGHSYYREPDTALGLRGELVMNREVTALTGACVGLRRDVFEAVGGFSEALPVNYNDVDLALKVARLGLRRVWLHECVLFHFESATRSPVVHQQERDTLWRRWGSPAAVRERYLDGVP